jgi:hypothetical protein
MVTVVIVLIVLHQRYSAFGGTSLAKREARRDGDARNIVKSANFCHTITTRRPSCSSDSAFSAHSEETKCVWPRFPGIWEKMGITEFESVTSAM